MAARKILVLFAHPALQKSRINIRLLTAVRDLPNVTVHDLYERYPAFDIDVAHEQAQLLSHDVVVWHHPFYWYSSPALLKEWQDLVLEHGFAYGRDGTRLHGKLALNVITTGGPSDAYSKQGYNRFTLRELLAPFDQTAALCGMRYLAPFVVSGTHRLQPERDVPAYAAAYRHLLAALSAGTLDLARAAAADTINHLIPAGKVA